MQAEGESEVRALAEFMKNTVDLNQDEETCLRFLRAREENLIKAEEMMRKSLKWREDNNISEYLHWIPPVRLFEEFRITYSCTGYDRDGRPVMWLPVGNYKGKECIEAGCKEDLRKLVYHMLEKCVHLAKRNHTTQVISVLDMKNLSLRQVIHRETMQALYAAFQDMEMNYPEILHNLFILNAPTIFSIAFKFIKPILSGHTLSKLQVFNSDTKSWMEYVLQKVPPESVPHEYIKECGI